MAIDIKKIIEDIIAKINLDGLKDKLGGLFG